ncbi:TonB-dependent receptor plug domain-containing protein, partial [Sphingomonas sp. 66-10]
MSRVAKRVFDVVASSNVLAFMLVAGPGLAATPATADNRPASTAADPAPEPDADANADGRTSDVLVTAQRREQRLQDVPTAVTALGGDLFSSGLGKSANEVLNLVPNATAGTQQHGRPRWWIRGVGAGQQQLDLANPVGFYLDDVYISNASATGLPLFDIEQVEVLRGPQGTLWGKNTTGGAINVISKKPSLTPRDNDNYVRFDYGSYNEKIIEGGVGLVVVPDILAVRVSGHF